MVISLLDKWWACSAAVAANSFNNISMVIINQLLTSLKAITTIYILSTLSYTGIIYIIRFKAA